MLYQAVTQLLKAGIPAHKICQLSSSFDYDSENDMIILPSWYATDGQAEMEVGEYENSREAAEAYVADGDYGIEPGSVQIRVWKIGLKLNEYYEIEDDEVYDELISVDIEIPENVAIRRDIGSLVSSDRLTKIINCDHYWEKDNVNSLGGTSFSITETCTNCGLERKTIYNGSQRNPGEASEEVTYWLYNLEESNDESNHS